MPFVVEMQITSFDVAGPRNRIHHHHKSLNYIVYNHVCYLKLKVYHDDGMTRMIPVEAAASYNNNN